MATKTPFGPLGYVTHARTYARNETFAQTIERVIEGCRTQLRCGFTPFEEKRLRHLLLSLKGSVAGRFLWQLGTTTVDKLGLMSLQNCASVVIDRPVTCYKWMFDALCLGVGVGANIEDANVANIEPVQYVKMTALHERPSYDSNEDRWESGYRRMENPPSDGDVFVVPDSREGWVDLLGRLLSHHFPEDAGIPMAERKNTFTFNTWYVREAGKPIKGFGGVASGHETLVWGLGQINRLLNRHRGNRPTPTLLLDISTIIGHIVVSGNVRRSALIMLGTADNQEYVEAKNWGKHNVPHWRSNSNNSINVKCFDAIPDSFWDGYDGSGEPYGLVNLDLCREAGQVPWDGDGRTVTFTAKKDPKVVGVNPCSEQPLGNFETCCLAETFLPNCEDYETLREIVFFLYRICKHSLALPCHWKQTEDIVHENMRMGIGISGYLEASEAQKVWLPTLAQQLDEFDVHYSRKHGFPCSVKLRTVKPSGSLSLLAGVTAGGHPAYARHYVKAMRFAADHPLVKEAQERGYRTEYLLYDEEDEDTGAKLTREDKRTMIVEFPVTHRPDVVLADNMTAIDQLEVVRRLQRDWSDNAVSVTVYYHLHELPSIRAYLKQHWAKGFKAVSFLLRSGHGFRQAPWQKITEQEYEERIAEIKRPFGCEEDLETAVAAVDDDDLLQNSECDGGSCPRR